jgi:hypothetical protein
LKQANFPIGDLPGTPHKCPSKWPGLVPIPAIFVFSGRFTDVDLDEKPRLSGEIDQSIQTEIRDPATQKIIETWLRNTEPPRGFDLRYVPASYLLPNCNQQFGPHRHIRGFGWGIFQSIPDIIKTLTFHRNSS